MNPAPSSNQQRCKVQAGLQLGPAGGLAADPHRFLKVRPPKQRSACFIAAVSVHVPLCRNLDVLSKPALLCMLTSESKSSHNQSQIMITLLANTVIFRTWFKSQGLSSKGSFTAQLETEILIIWPHLANVPLNFFYKQEHISGHCSK